MLNKLEDLLPLTKYYVGGDTPPDILNEGERKFWEYERDWVNMHIDGRWTDEYDTDNIMMYLHHVTPLMSEDRDVPTSLLAFIFIRGCKWAYSAQDYAPIFVENVKKYY